MKEHKYHNLTDHVNCYFDNNFKIKTAKILPGEFYATNQDIAMTTLLGSCVSACLRDSESGIGGMNHFMLPDNSKLIGSHGNIGVGGRYGVHAMELLINQILKLGGRREKLEAKVFGGGNVIENFTISNIGKQNADFILEYLQIEKIKIVSQDLLDVWPRKIFYWPKTGKVLVKKIKKTEANTIFIEERNYSKQIIELPLKGDMEIFK